MKERESAPTQPVAGPLHTLGLLVILATFTWLGIGGAERMRAGAGLPLRYYYCAVAIIEWLMVVYIAAGVRHHGGSMRALIGGHWTKAGDFGRDALVAFGFWLVALVVLGTLGYLLRVQRQPNAVRFLAPRGTADMILWVLVSSTAGICEETIFRGYLQRQFAAMSQSAPVGIVLSAAAFGAAHAYQGQKRSFIIGVFGAMFGILAYRRRSLRPGMMAHAWHDSLTGLIIRFLPK